MKRFLTLACALVFLSAFSVAYAESVDSESVSINDPEWQKKAILCGELLSWVRYDDEEMGKQLVIKVKITGSLTNDMTVKQNYINIWNLAKTNYIHDYTIQYWAVADMIDGKEKKVISFDVPASVVNLLETGRFPWSHLPEYVDNLWILPSLR